MEKDIVYRTYTKKEAIEWQQQNPSYIGGDLDFHPEYYFAVKDDDIVCIAAFSGDRLIGRNLITNCKILVNGKEMECSLGQNMYVESEFRNKGVGPTILMRSLTKGRPQICAAVSNNMFVMLNSWHAYTQIDDTPVFPLPLGFASIIHYSRLSIQKRAADGLAPGKLHALKLVMQRFSTRNRILKTSPDNLKALDVESAIATFDEVASAQSFPIQVPWNKSLQFDAIRGKLKKHFAWTVCGTNSGKEIRYHVSVYLMQNNVRALGKNLTQVKEAILSEIFPPVENCEDAQDIIHFCAQQMLKRNIQTLKIHAPTPALVTASQYLKLESLNSKTVFIAPRGQDKETSEFLRNPDNWWCRAFSESQFDETVA